MRPAFFSVIALGLVSLAVSAGEADICYSPAVAYASAVPPTNETVFECPIAGSKTLPELAADGWEVVQLTPLTAGGGTQITNQLVIQRKS